MKTIIRGWQSLRYFGRLFYLLCGYTHNIPIALKCQMRTSRIWSILLVIGNLGFPILGILVSGRFPNLGTGSRIREYNNLVFGNSYIWDFPKLEQVLTIPRTTNSRKWESIISPKYDGMSAHDIFRFTCKK